MLITGIIISYLLGSIPTAYLLGRISKRIDIRQYGSGNVGATNALRVLGSTYGILVLIIDILKGFIVVTILANYFITLSDYPAINLRIIFAITCVCGHNWSLFLKFKGGKGVATTFGVLAGLGIAIFDLRMILLLVIAVWLVVFLIFRIVSISSISSAISLPLFMLLFQQSKELLIFSIILAIFIIQRHKNNIAGLLKGNEQPILKK